LNNAAKYGGHSREIVVRAGREASHGVISVRDFGVGIPADMLERVFDMFTQVPSADRGGQSGLGIGLTLVRSLVHMHGGTITASSEGLGKGSTFTFRLPLVGAPVHDVRPAKKNGPYRLSLRVLVVDDNRDAAQSMGL